MSISATAKPRVSNIFFRTPSRRPLRSSPTTAAFKCWCELHPDIDAKRQAGLTCAIHEKCRCQRKRQLGRKLCFNVAVIQLMVELGVCHVYRHLRPAFLESSVPEVLKRSSKLISPTGQAWRKTMKSDLSLFLQACSTLPCTSFLFAFDSRITMWPSTQGARSRRHSICPLSLDHWQGV